MNELYKNGFNILNELRLLPLKIIELNNEFKNNTIIPKIYYLNNESKYFMKNIKDIKIIIMDNDFNEKVKLPKGLKKLTMGKNFNKKIKFPEELEIINFGQKFNQSIIKFPEGLKYLSIPNTYKKSLLVNDNIKEFYVYKYKEIILPITEEERKKQDIILDHTTISGIKCYRRSFIIDI
jgi:hypothetical protein